MDDDQEAGILRRSSGELVPQPHGGALRRGGGAPPRSEDQRRAFAVLKGGAEDAAIALVNAARGGDTRAAGLVLLHAIGRPPSRHEVERELAGPDEITLLLESMVRDLRGPELER